MITISREITNEDMKFLVNNMTKKDLMDCSFQFPPKMKNFQVLVGTLTDSVVVKRDGVITNVGGLQEFNKESASVWLLRTKYAYCGTEEMKKAQRKALDAVLDIAKYEHDYKVLTNVVWQQQTVDIKWLLSVGFEIHFDDAMRHVSDDFKVGVFFPITYEVTQ